MFVIVFLFLLSSPPHSVTFFPYTTLFRSWCPPRATTTCCICRWINWRGRVAQTGASAAPAVNRSGSSSRRRTCARRSEEHTSELQSRGQLVCRLLLEKKKLRSIIYGILFS